MEGILDYSDDNDDNDDETTTKRQTPTSGAAEAVLQALQYTTLATDCVAAIIDKLPAEEHDVSTATSHQQRITNMMIHKAVKKISTAARRPIVAQWKAERNKLTRRIGQLRCKNWTDKDARSMTKKQTHEYDEKNMRSKHELQEAMQELEYLNSLSKQKAILTYNGAFQIVGLLYT